MNSFMSSIKSAATGGSDDKKTNPDQQDLMSSAKLVAEAAQSVATNQTDKVDKNKVAGAGAELLGSVEQYGKFDESQGVGQYIKQGEDYLRQYEKSGATATQPPVDAPPAAEEKVTETPAAVEEKKDEALPPAEEKKEEVVPPVEEKKESGSEFAAGDAVKAAGSLFK